MRRIPKFGHSYLCIRSGQDSHDMVWKPGEYYQFKGNGSDSLSDCYVFEKDGKVGYIGHSRINDFMDLANSRTSLQAVEEKKKIAKEWAEALGIELGV